MWILLLIATVFVIAITFLFVFYNSLSSKLDENAIIPSKASVRMTDVYGNPLDSKYVYRYIPYEDISSNIVNAFVAIEDKRYFTHKGVDYYRTVGALFHNVKAGKIKEGGSTITQQLIKNTLLSSEKTLKRKVREMALAHDLEKRYDKEEILEMYLNAIYYGNGIYGIDSACYNYFGKKPSEISPAEAAVLAGIVKNPAKYSPTRNAPSVSERKNIVLKLMREQNFISEQEYEDGLSYAYSAPQLENDPARPYFINAIHEAADILGVSEEEVIRSDYVIRTYYDPNKQSAVVSSFKSKEFVCKNDDKTADYSVILADNSTGGVNAYYSTLDNNVFSFRRSPASTIKPPLVYAPAIEMGQITEKTYFNDQKSSFNGYSPSNYGDIYYGSITADKALAKSVNTVAVRILQTSGIDNSIAFAEKSGITFDKSDYNHLAIALGGMTYGVTLPELAESYMTLASSGNHKNVTFIQAIETSDGLLLYAHKPTIEPVFSSDTAFIVTDMLKKSIDDGTSRKLSGFSYDLASKTGTAETANGTGNSDAWNVNYTTENTMCVWYGSVDSYTETTGGGYPTLLAADIRRKLGAPKQPNFVEPITVCEYEIDAFGSEKDGKTYLSSRFTPTKYKEKGYFSVRNAPTKASPYFDISSIRFNVEINREEKKFFVSSSSPFRYKLIERNLGTREVKEYENIPESTPNDLRKNAIYSYYLAVYCDNEFLGYTPNKIVFT